MTFKEVETERQKGALHVSREYGLVRVLPLLNVNNEHKPPKGFMKDFNPRPYGKVSAQNCGASSDSTDRSCMHTIGYREVDTPPHHHHRHLLLSGHRLLVGQSCPVGSLNHMQP